MPLRNLQCDNIDFVGQMERNKTIDQKIAATIINILHRKDDKECGNELDQQHGECKRMTDIRNYCHNREWYKHNQSDKCKSRFPY